MLLDPNTQHHEFHCILLKIICARTWVAKILFLEVILNFIFDIVIKDKDQND